MADENKSKDVLVHADHVKVYFKGKDKKSGTVRAVDDISFDIFAGEMMCMGKERLEYYMAEIRKKGDSASKKELDTLKDMRIVQEMYARGFEFVPIDLYTAKAQRFQIVDGKLMPSLATIDGLGDKAADAVVDAAKQGKFLSKDDFRDRTKVSKTVIDLMDDLKLFGDIPQSNQMSLFDFTG